MKKVSPNFFVLKDHFSNVRITSSQYFSFSFHFHSSNKLKIKRCCYQLFFFLFFLFFIFIFHFTGTLKYEPLGENKVENLLTSF